MHLFFVDDVLLFVKATSTQVVVAQDILNSFCEYSGIKINMEKS